MIFKIYRKSLRKNYSGNLEYVSPEQIIHDIQDNRSDIWGLGILLYELLHGFAPFKNENYKILFENIYRNKQIFFQPNLTPEVIDLIQKLLNKLPSNRISLEEIYQHPWMKKYEKLFEISIDEFREKIKALTEKSNNNVERELILEEGFSPELSPTRKLKKKAIIAEEKDENNSKIKTEDNDDSEMEEIQGFFDGFLKKLTKFCKC